MKRSVERTICEQDGVDSVHDSVHVSVRKKRPRPAGMPAAPWQLASEERAGGLASPSGSLSICTLDSDTTLGRGAAGGGSAGRGGASCGIAVGGTVGAGSRVDAGSGGCSTGASGSKADSKSAQPPSGSGTDAKVATAFGAEITAGEAAVERRSGTGTRVGGGTEGGGAGGIGDETIVFDGKGSSGGLTISSTMGLPGGGVRRGVV